MNSVIMGAVHLMTGQFQAHSATDPRTVAAEHVAILNAIEAGEPTAATDHLSAHLPAAHQRLVARVARDQPAHEQPYLGARVPLPSLPHTVDESRGSQARDLELSTSTTGCPQVL
jgi:hypothetical protein